MRIAYYADNFYPELSGISDSILFAGIELARRGHEIHFFVPKYSPENYKTGGSTVAELDLGKNIHIHRIPSFSVKTPTLQGRGTIPHIWRGLFSQGKFDVVHTHSFSPLGIDALCLGRSLSIPVIGTNHTLIEAFMQYFPIHNSWVDRFVMGYMTWFYNRCDIVTTPCNFLQDDMRHHNLCAKGAVIPNSIEKVFFNPRNSKENLKHEYGLSPFTIIYAGRLAPEKGVMDLLEAFIRIAPNAPEAMLVLVGGGILKAEIAEKIKKSGLENRIKQLGPYLGDRKKILVDLYHASDVFVMPSHSEIQSMSILQAMASGIPIIAARAGGNPELLSKSGGCLFTAGNIVELQSYLEHLYKNTKERLDLGVQARAASEQFSVERVADAWEKLYRDACEENGN